MTRTFDPSSLVTVPLMTAPAAVALGAELRTVARDIKLPAAIDQSLQQLTVRLRDLRAVVGDSVPTPPTQSREARAVDVTVDACYSGTYDWCLGWSKLPEELVPGAAATAARIAEVLFPDGLKFTQLPFKLEWAQSQARLDQVDKKKLAADFEKLGGSAFLAALRKAHERYGKALGITQSKPEAEPAPELRKALDTFGAALRSYVVQIVAYADAKPDKGPALAEKLLAPLAAWESTARAAQSADQKTDVVSPAAPAAPTA